MLNWNFIKGSILSGDLKKRLGITSLGIAEVLFLLGIVSSFGVGAFIMGFMAAPALASKFKEKYGARFKELDHVPYWGSKFGYRNTVDLLDRQKFYPYEMTDGTVCNQLKVSGDGRWFYVAGHYYPLYLVRGYDKNRNELVMIDGARLGGQNWLNSKLLRAALTDLFKANRLYEIGFRKKTLDEVSETAFSRVWGQNYEALATADWDQIRYEWEKEVSELASGHVERSRFNRLREGLKLPDIACDSLHGRVLTDREIGVICDAIQSGAIKEKDLNGWFVMSEFKDDMCVGNGIRLLSGLEPRTDEESVAFLFDCIRDIQKPYFNEAIETLAKYPREQLIEDIEKSVSLAKQTGDVLWGAGLIYLSKKIDYEISLSRQAQNAFATGAAFEASAMAQAQAMAQEYRPQ